MRRFAELVRAGDEALEERLGLLRTHREDVLDRLAELNVALEMIDPKIDVYSRLVAADGNPPVALVSGASPARAARTAGRGGPARRTKEA